MFLSAPLIAWFYDAPELTAAIRVMSLVLIVSGIKNVQQAYVSRNMLFKRFFFATLIGTVTAAVVGIAMAYLGMGLWAIIAQNLINITIDTCVLWITVKWRPKKCFSFQRLKELYSFGWKLFASSLMEVIYLKLRGLIIGKKYSKEDLAFYTYGEYFDEFINTAVSSGLEYSRTVQSTYGFALPSDFMKWHPTCHQSEADKLVDRFFENGEIDTYYLVAPNFKEDLNYRLILLIDTDKVDSEIKWEDGGGIDFPHIYGLLNKDAIIGVYNHIWNNERIWLPNEELKEYAKDGFERKI